MDYRKKFVVEPGAKVRLAKIDASYTGKHETHEKALRRNRRNMSNEWTSCNTCFTRTAANPFSSYCRARRRRQGWHCSARVHRMNPQGTFVFGFKQPSQEEAAHDFLWRMHARAPGIGEVVIFNRSHYEDVLVVRVHKLVPQSVWSKRYDLINDFEKMLSQNGTTILKFFLYICPEEQLARFKQRLDDPSRHWKISESDYTERELWRNTSRPTRKRCSNLPTRSTRPGTSSRQTTSGSATSRYRRSSQIRWERWTQAAADAGRYRGHSPQVSRGGGRAEDRRKAAGQERREGQIAETPNAILAVRIAAWLQNQTAAGGSCCRAYAGCDCDPRTACNCTAGGHAARDRIICFCRRVAHFRRRRGEPLHVGRRGFDNRADLRRRDCVWPPSARRTMSTW